MQKYLQYRFRIFSLIILFGSMRNSLFWVYVTICAIILIEAVVFWKYFGNKEEQDILRVNIQE